MPRREQPYLPLYVMDFLTDEKLRECSAASVGVYIMLMCVMHKQEEYGTISLRQKDMQHEDITQDFAAKLAKHLPFDGQVIATSLRELLSEGVLHLDGQKLVQKRMVRDADISAKRAAAGKKGSATTNQKFDAAKQAAKDTTAEEKPTGTGKKRGRPRKSSLPPEQQALFERFYAAYPKKVDPAAAEKAWAKIEPPPDEAMTDRIVKAVEDAKKLDSRFRERKYTPHPATWLNAKGYLSEYGGSGDNGADTDRGRTGESRGGFTADPGSFKPSSGFKG